MRKALKRRYAESIVLLIDGEIPQLGSGMRRAIIRSKGHKWVSLIHPSAKVGCKVKRSTFDRIMRATERRLAR